MRWSRDDDAGFSLAEVLVNMAVMGVVGAVFTASILQVTRASGAMENQALAQSQVRLALQRLDTEIRYASDIAAPSTAASGSGAWYVEFLHVDPATADQECNQLRLSGGVLALRKWAVGAAPSAAATLASDIDMSTYDAGGQVPFELQAAGSTPLTSPAAVGASFSPDHQRLRLRFVTAAGQRRMQTDITFTALNTSRTTDADATTVTADVCKGQRT